MSVNKAILLGRVGKDPELKTMPSGMQLVQLSMATNHRKKNRDSGDWEDQTEWHRVVFFGKPAETISQYVQKGKELYVEGRIQTQKYTDKEGIERYSTDIIAETFRFVGGAKSSGFESNDYNQNTSAGSNSSKTDNDFSQDTPTPKDDDIPF